MRNHPGAFRGFFSTLAAATFLALTLSSCAVTVALPGGGSTTTPIKPPTNIGTGTGAGASGGGAPESKPAPPEPTTGGGNDSENSGEQNPPTKKPSDGIDDTSKKPTEGQPTNPEQPKDPSKSETKPEEKPALPQPGDGMVIDENCAAKWDNISNELVLTRYTLPINQPNVHFPTGGKYTIGPYAVKGNNNNLITITLPNDVMGIGKGAFQSAWIKEINIPNSIAKIDDEAFCGARLEKIDFQWNHPDSNLGSHLFSNCDILQSVTISGTIKRIPSGAFSYCANLQILSLPNGLETIGAESFAGVGSWDTPNLNIILPDSINTIEYAAFADSSLKVLYIPRNIQEIDESAFDGASIKEIYFEGTETEWKQWDSIVCSNLTILDNNEGVKMHFNKKPTDIPNSTPAVEFLTDLLSIF